MIKSYITLALRNLVKRRLYSIINILGLAIGVSVFLTILKYVDFELSYDHFHKDSRLTYRLITTRYLNGELRDQIPLTGFGIGPALKNDIPEVEAKWPGYYKRNLTQIFWRSRSYRQSDESDGLLDFGRLFCYSSN